MPHHRIWPRSKSSRNHWSSVGVRMRLGGAHVRWVTCLLFLHSLVRCWLHGRGHFTVSRHFSHASILQQTCPHASNSSIHFVQLITRTVNPISVTEQSCRLMKDCDLYVEAQPRRQPSGSSLWPRMWRALDLGTNCSVSM